MATPEEHLLSAAMRVWKDIAPELQTVDAAGVSDGVLVHPDELKKVTKWMQHAVTKFGASASVADGAERDRALQPIAEEVIKAFTAAIGTLLSMRRGAGPTLLAEIREAGSIACSVRRSIFRLRAMSDEPLLNKNVSEILPAERKGSDQVLHRASTDGPQMAGSSQTASVRIVPDVVSSLEKSSPLSRGFVSRSLTGDALEVSELSHVDRQKWDRLQRDVVRFDELLDSAKPGTEPGQLDGIVQPAPFEFKYKNRGVTGCLLHYAVYLGHELSTLRQRDLASITPILSKMEDPVKKVLDAKADLYTVATIPSGPHQAELEAVHIAAGIGCISALDALLAEEKLRGPPTDPTKRQRHYVDRYCYLRESPTDKKKFYTPLHDATYCGKPDSVEWLLLNNANANLKNKDGRTLLHHLAFIGPQAFQGTVFQGMLPEATLAWMVKRLLEVKVDLSARTKPNTKPANQSFKTPLEISALPGSQFPRALMYLLAPSCQSGAKQVSVFNDILLLSNNNMESAGILAQHISSNAECHDSVREQAQTDNAVDIMANLIYTAPVAACHILSILTVDPKIKDPGHNPITSRTSMAGRWNGVFEMRPLRSTYQQDIVEEGKIRWPHYACNNFEPLPWHIEFMPMPNSSMGRRDDLYDVCVKAVLLPNLMDVDIMWALACTWDFHQSIFQTRTIRGAIACLWENLVENAYLLMLSFSVVELLAILRWAFTRDENEDSGSNSDARMPFCFALLLGALFRDAFLFYWWFYQHRCKEADAKCDHDDTRVSTVSISTNTEDLPKDTESLITKKYQSLWSRHSFYEYNTIYQELIYFFVLSFLIIICIVEANCDVLPTFGEIVLAVNVLLRFVKVINMLRVFPGVGASIIAVLSSLWRGKMRGMLFLTSLAFLAFYTSFITLVRNRTMGWVFIYAYRGLIFGDGDGLDNLGLQPDDHGQVPDNDKDVWDSNDMDRQAHHLAMTTLMACGTCFFNIVILNLLIAVYSSEYEKSEAKSMLRFQQERARECCKYLLMLPNISWEMEEKLGSSRAIYCIAVVLLSAGLILPRLSPTIVVGIVVAGMIAAGQILWLTALMRSPWFPPNDRYGFASPYETQKPKEEDYFVWICSRTDYDEAFYKDDDVSENIDALEAVMTSRIDDVTKKLGGRLESLETKVDRQLDNLAGLVEQLVHKCGGRVQGDDCCM